MTDARPPFVNVSEWYTYVSVLILQCNFLSSRVGEKEREDGRECE